MFLLKDSSQNYKDFFCEKTELILIGVSDCSQNDQFQWNTIYSKTYCQEHLNLWKKNINFGWHQQNMKHYYSDCIMKYLKCYTSHPLSAKARNNKQITLCRKFLDIIKIQSIHILCCNCNQGSMDYAWNKFTGIEFKNYLTK